MTYLLIGLISLGLVACTVIYVSPAADDDDHPAAVSIQTHQSVDVLGSQVSDSSPKSARGDAHSGDVWDQTSKTTSIIPITTSVPIELGE